MSKFPVGFWAVSSLWPPHPALAQVTGGWQGFVERLPWAAIRNTGLHSLMQSSQESPEMSIFSSEFTKDKPEAQADHAALGHRSRKEPRPGQRGPYSAASPSVPVPGWSPCQPSSLCPCSLGTARAGQLTAVGTAGSEPAQGTERGLRAAAQGKGSSSRQLQPRRPKCEPWRLLYSSCGPGRLGPAGAMASSPTKWVGQFRVLVLVQ